MKILLSISGYGVYKKYLA